VGGISGKLISPERSCSGEEGGLWDGLFTVLLRDRLFRVGVVDSWAEREKEGFSSTSLLPVSDKLIRVKEAGTKRSGRLITSESAVSAVSVNRCGRLREIEMSLGSG